LDHCHLPSFPTRRSSDLGYLILALATSADSVQEATAYFGLLGLLSLSLGVAAVAHGCLVLVMRRQSMIRRAVTLILLMGLGYGRSEEHTSELHSPDHLVC